MKKVVFLFLLLLFVGLSFSASLEKKIARLFVVGFPGEKMNSRLEKLIETGVGGFILYSYNISSKKQIMDLIKKIKSKGDFLIFIDQEGSYVSRIKKGVFVPPNAMALGSADDPFLSYLCGYLTGVDLKRLGIDVNLAPVLDVNSNPFNPVIGIRSFWSKSERVVRNGIAFMRGMIASGILPVVKHFPGHGSTGVDSHTSLPVVNKSEESFIKEDIYPFKKAIECGAPAVMIGHILVPFWDGVPATMSSKVIEYLRRNLNFNGLIISDEISMGAITKFEGDISSAVIKALNAGIDMILISDGKKVNRIIRDVVEAIENGNLPLERIEEAFNRVEKIKRYAKNIEPINLSIDPNWVMKEVAENAIALMGNFQIEKGKRYLVISPFEDDGLKTFVDKMKQFGARVCVMNHLENIIMNVELKEFDGLLVFTRDIHRTPEFAEKINKILEVIPHNIVIALRSPYDLLFIDKKVVKSYSATYDWNRYFAEALFDILAGLKMSCGDFPFNKTYWGDEYEANRYIDNLFYLHNHLSGYKGIRCCLAIFSTQFRAYEHIHWRIRFFRYIQ